MSATTPDLEWLVARIDEQIQTAVRRELDRLGLLTLLAADKQRAAYVDARARLDSGMPNPNRTLMRSTANDLVLTLEERNR